MSDLIPTERGSAPVVTQPEDVRTRVIKLRLEGVSLDTLAETFDLSYQMLERYIGDHLLYNATPAEVLREQELRRLENLDDALETIQGRRHPVIYMGTDTGFDDDGPKLSAIDKRIKISERRGKLLAVDRARPPEAVRAPDDHTPAEDMAAVMEEVLRRNGFLKRPEADQVVDVVPVERGDAAVDTSDA